MRSGAARLGDGVLVRAVALVAVVLVAAACGSEDARTADRYAQAAFPAAMAPLPNGGLLYGERLTGRIRRVEADGRVAPEPVAAVAVSTSGQRGLLGLAVDGDRVFAAWTDADRRLVVAQVAPGPARRVWDGPPTARLANGGHLAFAPDGRLVVGVGSLQRPERVDDPAAFNGKLLGLAPEGPPDQRPAVISSDWNNPFAFTFMPNGDLWVADNAPGEGPERLTRGDRPGPTTELPDRTAPSGLASPAPGELVVCGYVSRELIRYEVVDGRAERRGLLAEDCRLGVVVLSDGRVVYSTEDELLVLDR